MTTEATTGSPSCLEGEAEVRGAQLQHATPPLDVTKSHTDPLTESTATLNEGFWKRASLLDVKLKWCRPVASSLMWDTCSSASSCLLCCSTSSLKPAASSSYPDMVLSTTARISRAAVLSFSVMMPLRISPTRCSATGSMLSPRTQQSNTTTGSGRNWRGMIRAAVPLPAAGRATNCVRLETSTGNHKIPEDDADVFFISSRFIHL